MITANVYNSKVYISPLINGEAHAFSLNSSSANLYSENNPTTIFVSEKIFKNKNSKLDFYVDKDGEVAESYLFFNVAKDTMIQKNDFTEFKEKTYSTRVLDKEFYREEVNLFKTLVTGHIPNDMRLESVMTIVNQDTEIQKYEKIEMAQVTVSNSTAFDLNNLQEAKINIDKFKLTIQLTSFMEYHFDFNEKKVDAILGLPNGIEFSKAFQKLHGSPTVAGNYNINIIFTDGTSLRGKIQVPKVKRDL